MPEPKCPPDPPSFQVVTPGMVTDELRQARYESDQFFSDLLRELAARETGRDELGHATYPPGWIELARSYDKWRGPFLAYVEDHDEWSENIFGSVEAYDRARIYRCNIIEFREVLRSLGGKATGPEPSFGPPPGGSGKGASDTFSSATGLLLAATGLYLAVTFAPMFAKRK